MNEEDFEELYTKILDGDCDWDYSDLDRLLEASRQNGVDEARKEASKEPISQERINEELTRFVSSVEVGDKIQLGHYILVALSGMAIDANSCETILSTEFTHSKKRYKAKMLITQEEVPTLQ